MNRLHTLILVSLLLLLSACEGDYMNEPRDLLVVEGWIENGSGPVVMLTKTLPISTEPHAMDDIQDYVVRFGAVVSVTDGKDTVVLTGHYAKDYYPPYVYSSSEMLGVVGKTYTLMVEYHGQSVRAKTVIPRPVPLDRITCREMEDGRYGIVAEFRDDPASKDWYKTFVKVSGRDKVFHSAYLGLIDDDMLASHDVSLNIYPADVNGGKGLGYDLYYNKGDEVDVMFCTTTEDIYRYWRGFEEVSSLSRNPLFPISYNLASNIQGGIGYWAGYGSRYYHLVVE